MAVWVVAVEYAGADLELWRPAPRRPVLEHAYDLDSGLLAHGGDGQLRVAFPHPTRGWPGPAQLTRCVACTVPVTAFVTGTVADIVGRVVTDLTRWAVRFSQLVEDELSLCAPPLDPYGS